MMKDMYYALYVNICVKSDSACVLIVLRPFHVWVSQLLSTAVCVYVYAGVNV